MALLTDNDPRVDDLPHPDAAGQIRAGWSTMWPSGPAAPIRGYNSSAPRMRSPSAWSRGADDGVTVEGLLGRPAGAGPHPMFVFLHGGPVAGLACGEHPDPSGWVSSGLAFFMPDFRSAATSPAASSPAMTAFAWPYPAKASPTCGFSIR